MSRTPQQRWVFFLARLPGLWFVMRNMRPEHIVEQALKKWKTPSVALKHLLQMKSPGLNMLHAACLLWGSIEFQNQTIELQTMRTLLASCPLAMRASAFEMATNSDTLREAHLLTVLPPLVPPGLTPAAQRVAARLESAGLMSDDLAVKFFQSLAAYGASQLEVQWFTARTLILRNQHAQAEPLLLELAQNGPTPEIWWQLALVLQVLQRAPQQRLRALHCFIQSAPLDPRTVQALAMIGALYSAIRDNSATSEAMAYFHTLRALLAFFPEHMRPQTLALIAESGGDDFLAQILTALPLPTLSGLTSTVQSIMARWEAEPRSDDLAMQFYRSLPAYAIAEFEASMLMARALSKREDYALAEAILKPLAELHAVPEALWCLACVYQALHRPPQVQTQTLLDFLTSSTPEDRRTLLALRMLGDVLSVFLAAHPQTPEAVVYLRQLRAILASFPVRTQAEAFEMLTNHDETFAIRLLCSLPAPVLPGLTPCVKTILASWQTCPRSDELALQCYDVLPLYGIAEEEVQLLHARAYIIRGQHLQAEPLLKKIALTHPAPDVLWYLATVYQALQHPPQLQLEAWLQFATGAQADERLPQALQTIGVLFKQICNASKNLDDVAFYLQELKTLLESFPESKRVEVLHLIANAEDDFQALIFSTSGTQAIAGLSSVARGIKTRWEVKPRSDLLALQFYRALPGYGVLAEEVLLLLARAFIARAEYSQAEEALVELLRNQPPPAAYWYLAHVYRELRYPPYLQHEMFLQYVAREPAGERTGQAWKMIGDLRGDELGAGMAAVKAYQQAVELGQVVPQLTAFYAGQWDAIAALRQHADYAFPVVVTIDLEVDSAQKPEAQPGTRVFEVAAVRYKGQTCLEHYHSYLQRTFCPAKWDTATAQARLRHAPSAAKVARALKQFIGNAIVVGHNMRAFDAPQLEGLGVPILKAHIIDTLHLARLLHPDSLRHHLGILCQAYHIEVEQASLHSALADAQACARLFHAMGESLARSEAALLAGIRALVTPGSAFDRAILQPRTIAAGPALAWHCDAAPAYPVTITPLRGNPASPAMQKALHADNDQYIEHTDFDACYASALATTERTLVTVAARTRIERLLAQHPRREKIFVLPDPQTLLCPVAIRQAIEACPESEQKLRLYCLYQASHNHDAATLYPLRLPPEALDDPELAALRQLLSAACCASDSNHGDDCPARQAVATAIETHPILLSTHEVLFRRQATPVQAETIVIDDIVHLQMHLAEYCADTLTSSWLKTWLHSQPEQEVLAQLERRIYDWAIDFRATPAYHERLPLSSFMAYLAQDKDSQLTLLLAQLKRAGQQGERVALRLQEFLTRATTKATDPLFTHACWIDLWFENRAGTPQLQSWQLCGISEDLRQSFQRTCWQSYKKHLLAGTVLTTGGKNVTFLQRSLGISGNLPVLHDARPKKIIHLPRPEMIPPGGLLHRRKWIVQVGALLAAKIEEKYRAILVTLNDRTATEAFLQTFQQTHATAGRQLLATQLKWTVTKINERMSDPARQSLVFAAPALRQTLLDSPVDLEISGPLRFLNRRDPLVIAQMQVFSHLYPEEGPFKAYLLPQALFELQARLTSEATEYIICDGGLLASSYRDDVHQVLKEHATVQELSSKTGSAASAASEQFLAALSPILVQHGLDPQLSISDADLSLVLRSVWDTSTFRTFPALEGTSRPLVSQKDVVRTVLNAKDQLVIAATGGGKSLCFQLPAIILEEEANPKVTLIFSPLIALMVNQVEQLNAKGIAAAIMLNSTLSLERRQEHLEGIKKGYYSIIYLAPEQIYSPQVRAALRLRDIGLVAIDEAHCLSQWGHNFRTDYFAIKKWIDTTLCQGRKREFPILALTATARMGYKDSQDSGQSDQASTVTDIIEKLGLRIREDEVVLSSAIRPELQFHFAYITPQQCCPRCKHSYQYQSEIGICPACAYQPRTDRQEVQQIVADLKRQQLRFLLGPDAHQKHDQLPHLYPRWSQPFGTRQRGLIYCAYQKTTEEIATFLKEIPALRVGAYHAGMDNAERDNILSRFTSDREQGLDIVVCTNAFGMGIDIRRLGFVIHFDTPATPEAYYQEAGRAGRDSLFQQEKAQCILLFHPGDLEKQRLLSSHNSFTGYEIEDVYTAIRAQYDQDKERVLQSTIFDTPTTSPTSPARQIYASVQELAERAGVQEERVNTLLYYLEYQTKDKVDHRPVVERGAYASNMWQLSFARDYLARLPELPPGSASRPMLKAFQQKSEYQLSPERFVSVSARELADGLHLSLRDTEAELINLLRKGIIQRSGSGQFKLHDTLPALKAKLKTLEQDLCQLLQVINNTTPKKKAFEKNEWVTVNIRSLLSTHNLNTVTVAQLTRFLAGYALASTEPLRLFEQFRRATRFGQADHYELQRWLKREPNTDDCATIHEIIQQLDEKLAVLATRIQGKVDATDWYAIDVFDDDLQLDYRERRNFHRQLLLLETLGFLKYRSDAALGQAIELTLLQPSVSHEQLEIDLQSLRLQESYAKSKRKLMEDYATPTQEELYAHQFARYFQGDQPLLAHNQHELRQDLTPQQRQVATISSGTHVIVGPAGCGKTLALAEHVKHLINQQVPIDHIMITTHYTSAEGHIADALKDLESEGATAITTTIDAFGYKIFHQNRSELRRPDGNLYYSQAQPPQLLEVGYEAEKELPYINQALKQVATMDFAQLVHHHHWPWPSGLELPHFSSDYRSNATEEERFQAAIHRLRQHGIFPTMPPTGEILTQIVGEQTGIYSVAEFYAVYMTFLAVLAQHNLYTFDELIVFALGILRSKPDILHAYQRYFEHIIIDELQDFSPAKIELLMLLCAKHTNIMAFGDIFQDVQFDKIKAKGNSADVKVTAQAVFSRLAQLDTCNAGSGHQLTVNFRSTQEILDYATFIRRKVGDQAGTPLQSSQNKHGPKPTYLYTTSTASVWEMVNATLEQIEQLSAAEKESVALIFGNNVMLGPAQNILKQRNIPYSLMAGLKTTYQLHYVKNLLLYLYLVEDKTRDEYTERLLRYNIVPYFEQAQMHTLKKLASKEGISLFEALSNPKHLQAARISKAQEVSLQRHLALINQCHLATPLSQLEQKLSELQDGPLILLQEQERKLGDLKNILQEFRAVSIQETIAEIRCHITFLDKHRGRTDIVLATVECSKSQEFETVFLLGLSKVFTKRLYVSVSRAKQRLFLVGDEGEFRMNRALSEAPRQLYTSAYYAKALSL